MKKWEDMYVKEITLGDMIGNIANHWVLLQEIFNENPRKILEIGTGSGTLGIFLSHFGFEVVSIDNSEKIIKTAKIHNKILKGKSSSASRTRLNYAFQMTRLI